jgi:hypothetical protein
MSGPSATAKPISAKIAVNSSITCVIGWTRPISAGVSRTGSVTSTLSVLSRASSARLEGVAPRGERRVDAILEAVDQRPLSLALLRRQRAQRLQQRRDRAALAECRHAHRLERGFVAGGGDLGEDLLFKLRGVGHRDASGMNGKIGVGGRRRPGQHAMHLAAMMGLVIEQMGDQIQRGRSTRAGRAGIEGLIGREPGIVDGVSAQSIILRRSRPLRL